MIIDLQNPSLLFRNSIEIRKCNLSYQVVLRVERCAFYYFICSGTVLAVQQMFTKHSQERNKETSYRNSKYTEPALTLIFSLVGSDMLFYRVVPGLVRT